MREWRLLSPPQHDGRKEEGQEDNTSQHNASQEQLALGAVVYLTPGPCGIGGRFVCLHRHEKPVTIHFDTAHTDLTLQGLGKGYS